MAWWLYLIVLLVVVFFVYLSRKCKYWTERGVPQQGFLELLKSSFWDMLLNRRPIAYAVLDLYNLGKDKRYYGVYQFGQPTLLIKDLELLKQITVKDFDHFQDHKSISTENVEPLWLKNLISLKGQKWRYMRATLSPSFTGIKMRAMFTLISECSENFVKHFLEKKDEDLKMLEMKDVFTRFTNDVIASVAFGIKCDSLANRDNEFYLMGKRVTNFSGFWKTLKFILIMTFPKTAMALQIRMFDKDVSSFFCTLIKETITYREKHGVVRPDMLQLLIDAKKVGLKYEESNIEDAGFAATDESEIGKNSKLITKEQLTDMDITAQALLFFFAGFETVSSEMCFICHELAVNPDVQERLRQEVDETLEAYKGTLTYEAVTKMKYMDMVVSESLRKWPPAGLTDRLVTKPYTISSTNPNENPLHLVNDDLIWIPIYALHHDPEYYPNPEKFDPERFNDENKSTINPYSYLPFGAGPRNCIGSRFALMEIKSILFYILTKFEIVPNEKTQIPLKLASRTFNMTAEKGFWVGFKRRL